MRCMFEGAEHDWGGGAGGEGDQRARNITGEGSRDEGESGVAAEVGAGALPPPASSLVLPSLRGRDDASEAATA